MAFSVKLSQKTQTGGVNPVVATRTLLDDISSTASTVAFEKEVSMTGNVTIGDASSDSLLLLGGRIQSLSALEWTCKDGALSSLKIGSSAIPNLINIDTNSIPNKVTIQNLEVIEDFTKIETTNLTIKDPLIKLGNGNTSDSYDLGFYCQYKRTNENTKYAGLFRDADGGNNDGKFILFTDLTTEPETTSVGSGYTAATLVVGSLESTTPIGVSSGGTGATNDSGARTNLGLGNVDNTSDADKQVSTAQQSALDAKQDTLTFGIGDTNAVKIDGADIANGEYAKFTADGLESKTASEVLSEIGASLFGQVGKVYATTINLTNSNVTKDFINDGNIYTNVTGDTTYILTITNCHVGGIIIITETGGSAVVKIKLTSGNVISAETGKTTTFVAISTTDLLKISEID
tara:strand:+ start:145 stop:1356 length:1212 start_codon:yes stop_codon:yes gene_type:complete